MRNCFAIHIVFTPNSGNIKAAATWIRLGRKKLQIKIITAGPLYLDIDAYAGIIAYAELLQKQGVEAKAVSTAVLNESVSKTVRSWPAPLETIYLPSPHDTYTLIDISTPEYFDTFVDHDRIDAVIDHHPGFEEYWQQRIGNSTHIEHIGAACTQVYEHWKRAGLRDEITVTSARLLMCGILDNTLNFGAEVTTQRDKDAYKNLMRRADLPANWPAQDFGECQAAIDKDPVKAVQDDTKTIQFSSRQETVRVGQCVVWNATEILNTYQEAIKNAFEENSREWFINVVSIGEGKSYFVCSPLCETKKDK